MKYKTLFLLTVHFMLYTSLYFCLFGFHLTEKQHSIFMRKKFGRYKYFSYISLVITAMYSTLGYITYTLLRIWRNNRFTLVLEKIHHTVFRISFSNNIAVSCVFWIAYCIDKRLVNGRMVIPLYAEFIFHLFPLIINIIDGFLINHRREWYSIYILVFFLPVFYGMAYYARTIDKKWLYPVLDRFNPTMVFFIFLFHVFLGMILSRLTYMLIMLIRRKFGCKKDSEGKIEV